MIVLLRRQYVFESGLHGRSKELYMKCNTYHVRLYLLTERAILTPMIELSQSIHERFQFFMEDSNP